MAMAASGSAARTALAGLALSLLVLAGASGCSRESRNALVDPAPVGSARDVSGMVTGLIPGLTRVPDMRIERGQKLGNAYFPIVPGAYSDFRVTRLGVGERYVRVSVGDPEMFFSRSATPFVYGDVPGQTRDSTLHGLREYYSCTQQGDVRFHGAQNNGFMSHTTPPVRILLANPKPGDAWIDSVYFESFLPGMIPFFQNSETYSWTISENARLALPGGVFRALRSSSVIDDLPDPAAARVAMRPEAFLTPGSAGWEAFARRGLAALPEPLRGTWFSRHDGMVARDWPSGQGEVNLNAVTYELIGRGMGPVPPPTPPPIDPGTQ
jgi:hypothetical protein